MFIRGYPLGILAKKITQVCFGDTWGWGGGKIKMVFNYEKWVILLNEKNHGIIKKLKAI